MPQDAPTRPSGLHEPEVTKAVTTIKQEPWILSDLKHDSAPSAARAQPLDKPQVSPINADVSCAIFVDLC